MLTAVMARNIAAQAMYGPVSKVVAATITALTTIQWLLIGT